MAQYIIFAIVSQTFRASLVAGLFESNSALGTLDSPRIDNIITQSSSLRCFPVLLYDSGSLTSSHYHAYEGLPIALVPIVNVDKGPFRAFQNWNNSLRLEPMRHFRLPCKTLYIYTRQFQSAMNLTNLILVFSASLHPSREVLNGLNSQRELIIMSHFYVLLISTLPKRYYEGRGQAEVQRSFLNFFSILFLEGRQELNYTICLLSYQLLFAYIYNFRCRVNKGVQEPWEDLRLPRLWKEVEPLSAGPPFFKTNYQAYILSEIFAHLNYSKVGKALDDISPNAGFEMEQPLAVAAKSFSSWLFVVTDSKPMQFLSCHREPVLSFRFYLRPFMPPVWYGVLGTLVLLVCLTQAYLRLRYGGANKIRFSALMYFVATIFKDPAKSPAALKDDLAFQLLLLPWNALSTTMSCAYLGIVITNLNSPLEGRTIESFEDAVCLQTRNGTLPPSSSNYSYLAELTKLIVSTSTSTPIGFPCFSLLSPLTEKSHGIEGFPSFLGSYKFVYWLFESSLTAAHLPLQTQRILHTIIQYGGRFSPEGATFGNATNNYSHAQIFESTVEELGRCEKSVYIASSKEIAIFSESLQGHFPQKRFHVGREKLGSSLYAWAFQSYEGDQLILCFKRMMESGIYYALERQGIYAEYEGMLQRFKNRNRTSLDPGSEFEVVRLGGSIQTIFYIWGVGLFAGIAQFLAELGWNRFEIG